MTIITVFYFVYIVYTVVKMIRQYNTDKKHNISKIIDLFCDCCLGVVLVFTTLNYMEFVGYNEIIIAISILLFLIGKILKKKFYH